MVDRCIEIQSLVTREKSRDVSSFEMFNTFALRFSCFLFFMDTFIKNH